MVFWASGGALDVNNPHRPAYIREIRILGMDPNLEPRRLPHLNSNRRRSGGTGRLAWLAAGWLFFGVGIVGVALPGLPTTGPMLLALACFARGSERLHGWLLNHRVFGPPLRRWQQHRVISIRAKITAISMMAGSFAYTVWLSPLPRWGVIAVGGLIVVGVAVVLRVPHTVVEEPTRGA